MCPKCRQTVGTYYHVIWDCPTIQDYWRRVVSDVNIATNLSLSMDPKVLLLGITDSVTHSTHTKLLLFYLCFYARKVLLQHWKLVTPPYSCPVAHTSGLCAAPVQTCIYGSQVSPKIWKGVELICNCQVAQYIDMSRLVVPYPGNTPKFLIFCFKTCHTLSAHSRSLNVQHHIIVCIYFCYLNVSYTSPMYV